MIGTLTGRVGEEVVLEGYAQDFDEQVVALEFSGDEGATWTVCKVCNADPDCNVNWRFSFVPACVGLYRVLVRACSGDGRKTPEPACVSIEVSLSEDISPWVGIRPLDACLCKV